MQSYSVIFINSCITSQIRRG